MKVEAKPILKWAGGKRQLEEPIIEHILKVYPDGFDDYYEPFCGGAAVFFALRSRGLIRGRVYLSDTNQELIEMYQCVRDDVDAVIRALKRLCQSRTSADAARAASRSIAEHRYYNIRSRAPNSPAARAARMIYLNKNGFNGLYRVNKSGGFNVPWNKRKTPYVPETEEIRAASRALQGAQLSVKSFDEAKLERIADEDGEAFVYFDPPYMPKHKKGMTPSFTAYGKDGFDLASQKCLADLAKELNDQGVPFLLSNADTPAARDLYTGLTIKKVMASRSVNSVGTGRGKVSELLVSNSKEK